MEQDVTSSKDNAMTLTFRCPAELEGLLPAPVPAALGLPDWFKAMPPQAFNAVNSSVGDTVKRCPPFIDAMTYGFLIPLICDLKVENGEFTWDNDLPPGGEVNFDDVVSDLPSMPRLDSMGNLTFRIGGRLTVSGDADGDYRGDLPITADYL